MMDLITLEAWVNEYPEIVWALAAGVFFVLEIAVAEGIGFIFAAAAALTMSVLITSGMLQPETFWWHIGWFFLFTAAWAVVLWRPLKRWFRTTHENIDNFIGTRATVESKELTKDSNGNAKWSGASMKARVHPDAKVDRIEKGRDVWVVELDGSTLLVDVVKRG